MPDEAVEAAYARRPHLEPPSNTLAFFLSDRASVIYEPSIPGQTRRVCERKESPKTSWWGKGGGGGGGSSGSKSGASKVKKEWEKEQRRLAKEYEKEQKRLLEEQDEAWRRYYKQKAALDREERKKQGATEKQLRALEKEDQNRAEAARKQLEKEKREESLRQTFGLRPPESQTLVAPTLYSFSQPATPKQSFFRSSLKPPKRPQLFKPPPTIPVKSASKSTTSASKSSPFITSRVVDSQTQARVFPGMSRAAAYAIMSLEEEDAKARGVPGWRDSGRR